MKTIKIIICSIFLTLVLSTKVQCSAPDLTSFDQVHNQTDNRDSTWKEDVKNSLKYCYNNYGPNAHPIKYAVIKNVIKYGIAACLTAVCAEFTTKNLRLVATVTGLGAIAILLTPLRDNTITSNNLLTLNTLHAGAQIIGCGTLALVSIEGLINYCFGNTTKKSDFLLFALIFLSSSYLTILPFSELLSKII